jgi:purine nucleosidase
MHYPLAAALAVGAVRTAVAPVVRAAVDTPPTGRAAARAAISAGCMRATLQWRARGAARCRVVLSLDEDFAPQLVETLLAFPFGAGREDTTAALASARSIA